MTTYQLSITIAIHIYRLGELFDSIHFPYTIKRDLQSAKPVLHGANSLGNTGTMNRENVEMMYTEALGYQAVTTEVWGSKHIKRKSGKGEWGVEGSLGADLGRSSSKLSTTLGTGEGESLDDKSAESAVFLSSQFDLPSRVIVTMHRPTHAIW